MKSAASRRYCAQVINPAMRLGFDLSYPFARHGELFISARHEIVSAFVWIPPAAAREEHSEVDANTLRGR